METQPNQQAAQDRPQSGAWIAVKMVGLYVVAPMVLLYLLKLLLE